MRATAWIRDLCADGDVEPHPGPRFVCKNVNGWQSKNKLYHALKAIQTEHKKDPVTAVFIQEHNLPRTSATRLHKLASSLKLLAVAGYAPPHSNGATYGGTAIIIPYDSIELTGGETRDDAVARVRATRRTGLKGRFVSCSLTVEGAKRKLVSAYAPAQMAKLSKLWMRASYSAR